MYCYGFDDVQTSVGVEVVPGLHVRKQTHEAAQNYMRMTPKLS
eukprot:CAMPEP_0178677010 /NCGR_PEP_ID=MMETSP0698-20121128/36220_1 /TAXON_ID=265572 /ORGANISM="Extubocellulus spinifer, Strain CCMP396" /LENGTH=42 /DNA_ID= /DNA_START= /DNA_END= /DNA_ORIENTATION=